MLPIGLQLFPEFVLLTVINDAFLFRLRHFGQEDRADRGDPAQTGTEARPGKTQQSGPALRGTHIHEFIAVTDGKFGGEADLIGQTVHDRLQMTVFRQAETGFFGNRDHARGDFVAVPGTFFQPAPLHQGRRNAVAAGLRDPQIRLQFRQTHCRLARPDVFQNVQRFFQHRNRVLFIHSITPVILY